MSFAIFISTIIPLYITLIICIHSLEKRIKKLEEITNDLIIDVADNSDKIQGRRH